jgi:hypothetical protein
MCLLNLGLFNRDFILDFHVLDFFVLYLPEPDFSVLNFPCVVLFLYEQGVQPTTEFYHLNANFERTLFWKAFRIGGNEYLMTQMMLGIE